MFDPQVNFGGGDHLTLLPPWFPRPCIRPITHSTPNVLHCSWTTNATPKLNCFVSYVHMRPPSDRRPLLRCKFFLSLAVNIFLKS